jgi:hypothetical protein
MGVSVSIDKPIIVLKTPKKYPEEEKVTLDEYLLQFTQQFIDEKHSINPNNFKFNDTRTEFTIIRDGIEPCKELEKMNESLSRIRTFDKSIFTTFQYNNTDRCSLTGNFFEQ